MDIRYTTHPGAVSAMSTEALRSTFLLTSLFQPGIISLTYSEIDRAIVGSAVPVNDSLVLTASKKEMAAEYFCERREAGIINIGAAGSIIADGTEFLMETKDALYIGRGTKNVEFRSSQPGNPAKFYIVSYPAHKEYPTSHSKFSAAEPARLGSVTDANKRTIYKYIHPNGIKSCQLVMGLTELEEGSVWNTMPVHTHQRRTEVYMYFNIAEDAAVFHMMGQPQETKHLVVRDGQAVISPSWSIHSGVGTRNYTFIWGMGGENQVFDDMDFVPTKELR